MTGISTALSHWLPYRRSSSSTEIRLFCFPYAGGSASAFRPWQTLLSSRIEVCSIQYPGRENRLHEDPFTTVIAIAHELRKVLLPLLDRPFAFFGHSLGASIALELAHLLREEAHPQPRHLFVSAAGVPQTEPRKRLTYNLPTAEFIEEIRRLNGTPEEVFANDDLLNLLLSYLRPDFEMYETYLFQERPPLGFPLRVFGGLQDPRVSPEELESWREYTTDFCGVTPFPGDHFFLHTSRESLLRALQDDLL